MSKTTIKSNWFGGLAIRDEVDGAKLGLKKAASDLKRKSSETAPVDTGDLRGNCAIDGSALDSELIERVGYSLPYALKQHETLGYKHPKGGKAKYLEDPFNQNKGKYIDYIAKQIKNALKR